MNANPKFIAATAQVDEAAVQPLPKSRKVYVQGSRPDIRVPMREISQSDTPLYGKPDQVEHNPSLAVYDTSGPYTDPAVKIDIRSGLEALRASWIAERGDTEDLGGPSSRFGVERLTDPKLTELRFNLHRSPRRARAGANVSQMHYARRGIVTPEMEYISIRENQRAEQFSEMLKRQHPGMNFGAEPADAYHARVRARRSGARPSDHPGQHQSSGNRADDHRPQLPGEDQRQHRQLRGHAARSARKSRR